MRPALTGEQARTYARVLAQDGATCLALLADAGYSRADLERLGIPSSDTLAVLRSIRAFSSIAHGQYTPCTPELPASSACTDPSGKPPQLSDLLWLLQRVKRDEDLRPGHPLRALVPGTSETSPVRILAVLRQFVQYFTPQMGAARGTVGNVDLVLAAMEAMGEMVKRDDLRESSRLYTMLTVVDSLLGRVNPENHFRGSEVVEAAMFLVYRLVMAAPTRFASLRLDAIFHTCAVALSCQWFSPIAETTCRLVCLFWDHDGLDRELARTLADHLVGQPSEDARSPGGSGLLFHSPDSRSAQRKGLDALTTIFKWTPSDSALRTDLGPRVWKYLVINILRFEDDAGILDAAAILCWHLSLSPAAEGYSFKPEGTERFTEHRLAIRLLRALPRDRDVQEGACHKIACLSNDLDGCILAITWGAASVVMSTLLAFPTDLGVTRAGLKALATLCSVVNEKAIESAAELPAPVLGAMATFPNDSSVQSACCQIITHYSDVFGAEACQPVGASLQPLCGQQALINCSLTAIAVLGARGYEHSKALGAKGCCRKVMAAARALPMALSDQVNVCKAIEGLALSCEENREEMTAEGACSHLVKVLRALLCDQRAQRAGCRAVAALIADGSPDVLGQFGQLSTTNYLIDAYASFPHDRQICASVANAIWRIPETTGLELVTRLPSDLLTGLVVEIARGCPRDLSIQYRVLEAFEALAKEDSITLRQLVLHGAGRAIAAAQRAWPEDMRLWSLGCRVTVSMATEHEDLMKRLLRQGAYTETVSRGLAIADTWAIKEALAGLLTVLQVASQGPAVGLVDEYVTYDEVLPRIPNRLFSIISRHPDDLTIQELAWCIVHFMFHSPALGFHWCERSVAHDVPLALPPLRHFQGARGLQRCCGESILCLLHYFPDYKLPVPAMCQIRLSVLRAVPDSADKVQRGLSDLWDLSKQGIDVRRQLLASGAAATLLQPSPTVRRFLTRSRPP